MTTVGIEEEFHLVDSGTRYLRPAATAVLAHLPAAGFTLEGKQTTVETNSEPHTDLSRLRDDLARKRALLAGAALGLGLKPAAAGTMPLMRLEDAVATPERRYLDNVQNFAQIALEQVICGMHVHVGIDDRDVAAPAMAWISPWVPVLLAFSANSPYWLGNDTGYASWRTMLWQRWPTAGPAPYCASAAEYDDLVARLIRSEVVGDAGMIYHDLRLSAHVPTIELRVCDAVPDLDTTVLIAALFRALVAHACAAVRAGRPAPRFPNSFLRAMTWRAARTGLSGDLVDPMSSSPLPAAVVVRRLLRTVEAELRYHGDHEWVRGTAADVLARGDWAHSQRRTGRKHGLTAAVDLLTTRTCAYPPHLDYAPTTEDNPAA
ncbi:carboxylate-amine ligase [Yinghuangia sp. YIM S09857]|uniref:carboxylate-amine ligase n=1 Tax=Yinghuangia sp. YIM S09857 TaxID=3436929 RepID=UPI003F533AA4